MFVLDVDATLRLPAVIAEGSFPGFLDDLLPYVGDGHVHFTDEVIAECRRLAKGEFIATWLNAAAGSRQHKSIPFAHSVKVLAQCEELLDPDSEDESSQVSVAAMADYLQGLGGNFPCVVTEDRQELPTRCCLLEACGIMGIATMTAMEFVEEIGFGIYLSS